MLLDGLASAIRDAVTEPIYRRNARTIGERLATEDGAAPVIDWLRSPI